MCFPSILIVSSWQGHNAHWSFCFTPWFVFWLVQIKARCWTAKQTAIFFSGLQMSGKESAQWRWLSPASFANSMMCWPRNVSGKHSVCFHVHGAQNAQHTKRFPLEFLHEAGLAGLAFQCQISFRCWTPSHTQLINEWLLQFRATLALSGEVDRSWMWKDAKHWKVDHLNTIFDELKWCGGQEMSATREL